MSANLPTNINICLGEDLAIDEYFTDLSFSTSIINFGDQTEITLNQQMPAPHKYEQAGDYTLSITLYYHCGIKTVSSNVHVTCCTSSFSFDDATICPNEDYTPNFEWTNPNNPIHPFTYVVNFGDNSSTVSLDPSTEFISPTHQYNQPGTYTVTITLTWGAGCSISLSRIVYVRRTGSIPDLSFPLYAVCSHLSCPCLQPKWEGPTTYILGTDFNADKYDFQIWDDNNTLVESKMGISLPSPSYTSGDIFHYFLMDEKCKHYHYQLVLENCSETRLFTGEIYVKGCVCSEITSICIENCCLIDFDFSDATIQLINGYIPDLQWGSSSDPLFPFTYNISYGDGTSFSELTPGTTFNPPAHNYSTPGTYAVTITIDWGNGCTITITRHVSVIDGYTILMISGIESRIKLEINNIEVEIYPNPTEDVIIIDFAVFCTSTALYCHAF
jgi:PKD repeat protein